jgi:transposase
MLEVNMQLTVKTLFEKGYNKTQIGKILGIHRETVRKILKRIDTKGYIEKQERKSILKPYEEIIKIQVKKELSAVRIFEKLQEEYNFEGKYDSVRKYVSVLKKEKQVYMVLNSLPGEEAQVDFGYLGLLEVDGKNKKAWAFVMTLSYSRYMYVEIVLNQKVKTFIECHKNAFKYFGGIPETVKIDNLKSGIIENNFYEAIVQKHYGEFANHYGFMVEACRVYTPTDKGKVESGVKYVKNNFFKGRDFKNYEHAKSFLREWLEKKANIRIHGTTKSIPKEVFLKDEKIKLKELPSDEYTMTSSKKCKVYKNCHISYCSNYYSVPSRYIEEEVLCIEVNNILKIFYKDNEIALHPVTKDKKGHYQTNEDHYPHKKNITKDEIFAKQKISMETIGIYALEFLKEFIKISKNKYDYRTISGILTLRKIYDDETINKACLRAIEYKAYSYKYIKNICQKGLNNLPLKSGETYINPCETDITRDLKKYTNLAEMGGDINERFY